MSFFIVYSTSHCISVALPLLGLRVVAVRNSPAKLCLLQVVEQTFVFTDKNRITIGPTLRVALIFE